MILFKNSTGDNGKTNIEQILEETGKISSLLPMENNEDSDTESGSDGEKESDSGDIVIWLSYQNLSKKKI